MSTASSGASARTPGSRASTVSSVEAISIPSRSMEDFDDEPCQQHRSASQMTISSSHSALLKTQQQVAALTDKIDSIAQAIARQSTSTDKDNAKAKSEPPS